MPPPYNIETAKSI